MLDRVLVYPCQLGCASTQIDNAHKSLRVAILIFPLLQECFCASADQSRALEIRPSEGVVFVVAVVIAADTLSPRQTRLCSKGTKLCIHVPIPTEIDVEFYAAGRFGVGQLVHAFLAVWSFLRLLVALEPSSLQPVRGRLDDYDFEFISRAEANVWFRVME